MEFIMSKADESEVNALPKKRGLVEGLIRDTKNLFAGIVAAPAHFITNPGDVVGKSIVIGLSSIPGFGSFVTAGYVFKQSYRETGNVGMSSLKALCAGVATLIPGVGPTITGFYAVKNIGEQVERNAIASGKGYKEAIAEKYSKAGNNLATLTREGIGPVVNRTVAKAEQLFSKKGIKAIGAAVLGPLTPEQVNAEIQKKKGKNVVSNRASIISAQPMTEAPRRTVSLHSVAPRQTPDARKPVPNQRKR